MNKTIKLLSFDLDGTLAESKKPVSYNMAKLLETLLTKYHLCIITGGTLQQVLTQVIPKINFKSQKYKKFFLLPVSGSQMYQFNPTTQKTASIYSLKISKTDKTKIIKLLKTKSREMKLWITKSYGHIIEDRISQITYSALGQNAPLIKKKEWFEKNRKGKSLLHKVISKHLPHYDVKLGGLTSIDITHKGIDKAYGMKRLLHFLKIDKSNVLFFGDKLNKGENDYSIKAMGIKSIPVHSPKETIRHLKNINNI